MSGLQRDHSVNENWTNGSGYNDGTAEAAWRWSDGHHY